MTSRLPSGKQCVRLEREEARAAKCRPRSIIRPVGPGEAYLPPRLRQESCTVREQVGYDLFIAVAGEVASVVAVMSLVVLAVVPAVLSLAAIPASAAPVEGAALSDIEPVALPGVVALVPIESCGIGAGGAVSLISACEFVAVVVPGCAASA